MKQRLSRLAIVDAALALADRDGLDQVTMRSVASELNAAPMALYRHVKNKSALFDAMLERVLERVFVVEEPTSASWPEAIASVARQARRVLGAHPSWLPLLTRNIAPSSAIVVFERFGAAMATERVATAAKLDAVTSLMCFTLGFVLVERMMHKDDKVVPIEQLRLAREAGLTGSPVLASLAASFDGWSFDAAFESGLAALVCSLAENCGARSERRSS